MTGELTDGLRLVGSTLDEKYRIEEVVGEGGFSVVYRAEHVIWKQPVAVKCFKVNTLASEEMRKELLDAFVQEGKLMTELSTRTSAIVQARDIGTHTRTDGAWIPYMVLEWLEGRPLDSLIAQEIEDGTPPRSLEAVVTMLDGAAEALALAHRRNVVHRDLKPANLFVTDPGAPEESVKVLDFGVAKVMSEALEYDKALQQTSATITAFTPPYGAPEQFSRSHGATGPWTDVFAFALIVVELLRGGEPALEGDDYLQLAVSSTRTEVRPTPRHFGLDVSDEVEAVFAQALAVAPGDRYPSMGEFWRALHEAVFPGRRGWTPAASAGDQLSSSGGPRPAPLAAPVRREASTGEPDSASATAATELARSAAEPTGPATSATGRAATEPTGEGPRLSRKRRLTLAAVGVAMGVVAAGVVFAVRSSSTTVVADAPSAAVAPASATASEAAAPATCPAEMALVAGGKFFMGSDEGLPDNWKPAHKVELSPYCIDRREVTAAEYKACSDVGECKRAWTDSRWPKPQSEPDATHAKAQSAYSELCTFGRVGLEQHPINCVDWEMAEGYCKVRGKRLPTEAEWEYAARGSDGRKFPWGDEPPDQRHMNACGLECNRWEREQGLALGPLMYEADDGFAGTAPVGSFEKGRTMFGLDDMVGNVFEWTADWMGDYSKQELKDPTGPALGKRKVIRGGAFNGGYALWVNPAFRYSMTPDTHTHAIGFRCARSLVARDP